MRRRSVWQMWNLNCLWQQKWWWFKPQHLESMCLSVCLNRCVVLMNYSNINYNWPILQLWYHFPNLFTHTWINVSEHLWIVPKVVPLVIEIIDEILGGPCSYKPFTLIMYVHSSLHHSFSVSITHPLLLLFTWDLSFSSCRTNNTPNSPTHSIKLNHWIYIKFKADIRVLFLSFPVIPFSSPFPVILTWSKKMWRGTILLWFYLLDLCVIYVYIFSISMISHLIHCVTCHLYIFVKFTRNF